MPYHHRHPEQVREDTQKRILNRQRVIDTLQAQLKEKEENAPTTTFAAAETWFWACNTLRSEIRKEESRLRVDMNSMDPDVPAFCGGPEVAA